MTTSICSKLIKTDFTSRSFSRARRMAVSLPKDRLDPCGELQNARSQSFTCSRILTSDVWTTNVRRGFRSCHCGGCSSSYFTYAKNCTWCGILQRHEGTNSIRTNSGTRCNGTYLPEITRLGSWLLLLNVATGIFHHPLPPGWSRSWWATPQPSWTTHGWPWPAGHPHFCERWHRRPYLTLAKSQGVHLCLDHVFVVMSLSQPGFHPPPTPACAMLHIVFYT